MVPGVQLVAAKQDGLDHVAALGDLTLDTQLFLQEGRQGVKLLVIASTCATVQQKRLCQYAENWLLLVIQDRKY